jgi:signal transduction histidine kinase/CheY-like chemotaxis protein/putative methionine-R-sulfoxide reductase with GAF domain
MPNIEDMLPVQNSTQLLDHPILGPTERQSLQQDTLRSIHRLERLQSIVESLNRVSSVQQRLDMLLYAAMTAVPAAQQGAIYLSAGQAHSFVIGSAFPSEAGRVGSEVVDKNGYVDAVALVQDPVLIADAQKDKLAAYSEEVGTTRSALAVPFVVGGRTVGVIALENSDQPGAFSQQDLDFVASLAKHTALAVDHSRLMTAISMYLPGSHPGMTIWKGLAEQIPSSLLLIVPQRHYVWANAAFCQMTGFTQQELDNDWIKIGSLFPQDLQALCLESNGQIQEFKLVCQNASRCVVKAWFKNLGTTGVHGDDSYLAVLEDQTEHQELERKLFHMQRLSNVGALLSAISHELNNPLTAVIGFSELILTRPDISLEAREDLKTIVRQAERSVRVVRDLLDYVRLKDDGPTQIDLNHAIRQLVRFRTRALRKDGFSINLDLADSLPSLVGDARQIQQVLLNLINNAEQASALVDRRGEVSIRTRYLQEAGCVQVEVQDNGPGIPPEIEQRIFEPFFTTKVSGEGTGLGLSISKQIVERHQGRIWLKNRHGLGATFLIDLPVSPSQVAQQQPEPQRQVHPPSAPPARILVVDDEKSISHLLTRVLAKEGHYVDVVWSGSKAIAKLEETAYDIVFLDLKIPGLSGQAVYSWIKRDRPDLVDRTIIVTGDTLSSETLTFLTQECVKHLLKPFQVDDLRAMMRRIWPR